MAKITLEELRKLREQSKTEIEKREVENKSTIIIVGMGTCGIAAGARDTLKSFVENIEKLGLKDVVVKQTGCMGYCYVEPTVEVIMPDMPQTIYGKVTADVARKILEEHVIHKKLVSEHVMDKPAADIMK
ncbi:(2Fe-2S) ferredoxin domain-containing protein [Thermospira aquatica]|uniref:(2Fe-2S) ferredoxin domain-containing protein n=1 Tax=Thermospira aquatica TaxID=2828656 RepID=A0AAX3BE26_9SPIR|nr:(2Fe-2S) ferredoxin domain-containing protein [Thermospira aquatica]URA10476.1 (2Fe-2S) ferredoxin domain-containing protein [Thermospira aquatica]